ncbi:hypothetical protein GCM10017673_52470 [Streptosporangium violaceochromogenes]|nr:hypothetical protein GCM10017673_52470 [Streptosporangium violaceochromogenes]
MNLYERIAGTARGAKALASARLRHEVLAALHQALTLSGLAQSDVAKSLGVRRSAANQVFRSDGNVRINTLADYLFAMGFELDVRLVRVGEPRKATLERRPVQPAVPDWRVQPPCRPALPMAPAPSEVVDPPVRVRWDAPVNAPVAAYASSTANPGAVVSMRPGAA